MHIVIRGVQGSDILVERVTFILHVKLMHNTRYSLPPLAIWDLISGKIIRMHRSVDESGVHVKQGFTYIRIMGSHSKDGAEIFQVSVKLAKSKAQLKYSNEISVSALAAFSCIKKVKIPITLAELREVYANCVIRKWLRNIDVKKFCDDLMPLAHK